MRPIEIKKVGLQATAMVGSLQLHDLKARNG